MYRAFVLLAALQAAALCAFAQEQHVHPPPQPADADQAQAMSQITESMASRHIDMGPHMRLTEARPLRPGDRERGEAIVAAARRALEKYKDHRAALAEGFQIFLSQVPQRMYHFTNYTYAAGAAFGFDPERPTSLLYEKEDDGYRLVGVMYTAPWRFTEDELDARVPLSLARWHMHVNLCVAPRERIREMFGEGARFGMGGSITTREECEQEGGHFIPRIFGWMVHVYPWEDDLEAVWSLERQKHQH